ncbi:hypothetical protein DOTSEDRAFT_69080 [Dothistroma septosporum NZE10]|uniref:HTH APSES-type domain-containing protein n=1 Tax=Dothistroma septosporum (strain NZE10 / CBS 128990) TaxID=675120 RepID=N1PUB6_DOTSN|nr:hypothetical protein DOTSEDRAFT_69080 [Dothistroma septosporum NZE10]
MQPSPQQSASQPNGMPSYASHGYNNSFDGSQHGQSFSQPTPAGYTQSFSNGPVSNPGYARSFGDQAQRYPMPYATEKPQIYTAVYSGVNVYEIEISGVAVMRRRSDGWLNATQILKVAGVDKGKRTKVLEKEILPGEHEKVQGGYGKYQGTWISYRRGLEFCRQYGVEDILRPLLEYDVRADGSSGPGQQETPTKEQAMAAQRKKFYTNSSLDPRQNGTPGSNGTFFSNISPTTSVALAAMNKAARMNSPAPRAGSTPKPANMRRPSHQDNGQSSSQQSDAKGPDSGYITQNGEPPRKRMRPDSQDGMGPPGLPLDASMRSATPTEANESFLYENALLQDAVNGNGEPIALPPLPSPVTEEQQEKMNMILSLFAESGRTDYANHPALKDLSNEDLNMPLDASANNALHWAATLAKSSLMKLLIQKGASIWRGNAAGHTPLISAVLVNNCWEFSNFPELLEMLGPLIEVRDMTGRTVLHHIAVSCGIKGRGPSSKYYLEALLEFLVRIGTQPNSAAAKNVAAAAANMHHDSQQSNDGGSSQETAVPGPRGPVNLSRFLSHIVNARDKAGNTALNLVARIGNRSIIQQLLEIHADPSLPNNKGVCAKDFGVGVDEGEEPDLSGGLNSQQSGMHPPPYPMPSRDAVDADSKPGALDIRAEDMGQEFIASMTSMLTQNLASHKESLRSRTEKIDKLNAQIRELSALQRAGLERLQEMKERLRVREERRAKVANLRREVEKKKTAAKKQHANHSSHAVELEPGRLDLLSQTNGQSIPPISTDLPSRKALRIRLRAYHASNNNLRQQAEELRSRSIELERMYRKVVSLCTGVAEDKIEESLPALVAAVESEKGGLGQQEVGRVREFLRRVDTSKDPRAPKLDPNRSYDGPMLQINPTVVAAAERAEAERRAQAMRSGGHGQGRQPA